MWSRVGDYVKAPRGLFYWHDSQGIPPEIALRRLNYEPWLQWIMLNEYAMDALKAGWSKNKVLSEMRDLYYLGVDVPVWFRPKDFK